MVHGFRLGAWLERLTVCVKSPMWFGMPTNLPLACNLIPKPAPADCLLPPLYPEWLGGRSFTEAHGLRFPYVAGAMANGIATVGVGAGNGQSRHARILAQLAFRLSELPGPLIS